MSSVSGQDNQQLIITTPKIKNHHQSDHHRLKRTLSLNPAHYGQNNIQKAHSDELIQEKTGHNHKLYIKKTKSLKLIQRQQLKPLKKQIRYHHKVLLVLALTFFILCLYIMNLRSKQANNKGRRKNFKRVNLNNWSIQSQDLDQLKSPQFINLTNHEQFHVLMTSLKNQIDLHKKQLQQLQKKAKEKKQQLRKIKRKIKRVKNNIKTMFETVKVKNSTYLIETYNQSSNANKTEDWNITQSNAQQINKTIGMNIHTLNINQIRRYSLEHPPQKSYFYNNTVKVAGAIQQSHELGHVLMFMGVTVFILFIFMSVSPIECCHLFASLFVSGIIGFCIIEVIKNISKQDPSGV